MKELSEQQILDITEDYRINNPNSVRELAVKFGVSFDTIIRVLIGQNEVKGED